MILFFSATGNCKYVATRLAQAFNQEMLSITDCIEKNRFAFDDESIGVVSPTYDWGLPSLVEEFLKKVSLRTDYLYFVSTYGTTPGATGFMQTKPYRGAKSTLTIPFGWQTRGRRLSICPRRKK